MLLHCLLGPKKNPYRKWVPSRNIIHLPPSPSPPPCQPLVSSVCLLCSANSRGPLRRDCWGAQKAVCGRFTVPLVSLLPRRHAHSVQEESAVCRSVCLEVCGVQEPIQAHVGSGDSSCSHRYNVLGHFSLTLAMPICFFSCPWVVCHDKANDRLTRLLVRSLKGRRIVPWFSCQS